MLCSELLHAAYIIYIHTCIQAGSQAARHQYIDTCIHIHTKKHTNIHTYIYTHTHREREREKERERERERDGEAEGEGARETGEREGDRDRQTVALTYCIYALAY